ncbi:hypothetical protein O0L34_g1653 [Tuta absoluta]|nr:hypothetical protein O0L34_g1653 [Tuta absoluta]
MANLPPRKASSASSKSSKQQDATPLRILLQMGFPKHRALKALAATGNRSVQLASDWLLTHVNDAFIDAEEPREYVLYASPVGTLLAQLVDFWEKSKKICGWNGAHNYPPHITLVSFFKAPDDTSLQLGKALKHVVENIGSPPSVPLKLEPYVSHNFMGLFISEEHANYLKKIALQYVKEVSSLSVSLEAQTKCLHMTLAYHFAAESFSTLQTLVEQLEPCDCPGWELRLYSRDPRLAHHQVYKVIQDYESKASDELELVMGDYVYIEQKDLDASPDGWVHGTSWLTGVSGFLPAVYTQRTAESDAWTLHRAVSLHATNNKNNSMDSKSESESESSKQQPVEVTFPYEDAHELARDKSMEIYREWNKYWLSIKEHTNKGYMEFKQGHPTDWNVYQPGAEDKASREGSGPQGRWFLALRHGERVDLTYGPSWVPNSFDDSGRYVRKDLNLPLVLGERAGGSASYDKDSPLTRVGRLQAYLVGEALRDAGYSVKHVYASAALRCVETAHEFIQGLADPSLKVRVEPGLFELKAWHTKGLAPFMTPHELHRAGYRVDLDYKPYVEVDTSNITENINEFYERNRKVMHSAVKDTEAEGGNVIFVGHAATLDMMAVALQRLAQPARALATDYEIFHNLVRVPYCALGAVRDNPWRVVAPPVPPSINSSSGRFDWRDLKEVKL